jgi:hypothetical protein
MPVLTITPEEVCRIARLDAADETAFRDALGVIEAEQEAVEATLRPEALMDAALMPLLTLLVAKRLAAETLAVRSREAGVSVSFQGAGLTVGKEPDHAAALRIEADAGLLPYRRRTSGMITPDAARPAASTAQVRLYGAAEGNRYAGEEE